MNTYGLYKQGNLLGHVKAASKLQAHKYWDDKHPDNMADQVKGMDGNETKTNQFRKTSQPFWGIG